MIGSRVPLPGETWPGSRLADAQSVRQSLALVGSFLQVQALPESAFLTARTPRSTATR